MRRIIIFALPILAVLVLAFGHVTNAKKSTVTDTAQDVLARQQAYLDALHKRDSAAIGLFFADDFTFTDDNGQVLTKAQRLERMKSTPPPASLDFTDLKVRVYGDTALVMGHVTSAAGPNGQAINNRTMWVWTKQGGTWLLVAAQNTKIAPAQ